MAVDNVGSNITGITNTVAVFFSPSNPAVAATFSGSVGVFYSPSVPTVTANVGTGTMAVFFSPANPSVNIGSSSISVNLFTPAGTNISDEGFDAERVLIVGSHASASLAISGTLTGITNTVAVFFDRANPNVTANAGTGTFQVFLPDTGHELGTIRGNTNTLTVFLPDTGHELGTIRGNTNTLTVFLPDTGHTIGKVDAGAGTFSVQFSPSTPAVLANTSSTIILTSTASNSTSAVSTSGQTVVAPEAGRNIKIYAFSLTTTGVVSLLARFTNGAGVGPTEFWRLALQSPTNVSTGANLAVQPPGYLFATGVNTTLALLLDSATLVHYSVSYFKESA